MRRVTTAAILLFALGGTALAADLAAPQPAPVLALPSWTGFYAGLNVGGAVGSINNAFNGAGVPFPTFNTPLSGPVGGGQAGYNWQTGSWVLGLEVDFDGSGLRGSQTAPTFFLPPGVLAATYTEKLDWFGTLRPRIGYSLGNWLLYATGGGVLGEVGTDATAVLGPLAVTNSRSQTRGGWTVGGGVEVEIARGWSARIQYLYLDLGSHTTTYLPTLISNTAALRADVISGGVDYHF